MPDIEVLVAATAVESGRFRAVEMPTTLNRLTELIDQLRRAGQGYLEVRWTEHDFPMVSLGFVQESAVIHCASTPDQMALLRGDGSAGDRDAVEVLIMDDLATFPAEFVVSTDRAQELLLAFAQGAPPESLAEWSDL